MKNKKPKNKKSFMHYFVQCIVVSKRLQAHIRKTRLKGRTAGIYPGANRHKLTNR